MEVADYEIDAMQLFLSIFPRVRGFLGQKRAKSTYLRGVRGKLRQSFLNSVTVTAWAGIGLTGDRETRGHGDVRGWSVERSSLQTARLCHFSRRNPFTAIHDLRVVVGNAIPAEVCTFDSPIFLLDGARLAG